VKFPSRDTSHLPKVRAAINGRNEGEICEARSLDPEAIILMVDADGEWNLCSAAQADENSFRSESAGAREVGTRRGRRGGNQNRQRLS